MLLGIWLSIPGAVSAVQAQQAHQLPVSTLSDTTQLTDITVSATRFPVALDKIAQQVRVINRTQLLNLQQSTMADVLQQDGQVLVQKSQLGGGSPILRGFEANKLLIVVDGIRLNNAIYRGGHLQNILSIDPAVLDRVEVLNGPSAVNYGSDALGGVMSVYTHMPRFSNTNQSVLHGEAFVRYATAMQGKTGHAAMEFSGKKIAAYTGITVADYNDLLQGKSMYAAFPNWGLRSFYVERIQGKDSVLHNANPSLQKQTGYQQYDLIQKLLFQTGSVRQLINLQYSQTGDVFRYDRLTETNSSGKPKSAEWYYGPARRLLAAWSVYVGQHRWFKEGNITASYQAIEESRHNRNFNSVKRNHRTERVRIYALNADFRLPVKKGLLSYGAELVYNQVKSAAYYEQIETGIHGPLDTRYPDGGSHTFSAAVYGNHQQDWNHWLATTTGMRLSYQTLQSRFNDQTFFPFPFDDIRQRATNLSGSIGFIAKPNQRIKLTGLLSTGFRMPNVDDMAKVFESGNATLIVPNPNIRPERTVNAEFTIGAKLPGNIRWTATGWYTWYNQVLTTAPGLFHDSAAVMYGGNLSKVITVVNKNKAQVYGISSNLHIPFHSTLSLQAAVHYTKGRINDNGTRLPLDHIAPLYGQAALVFEKNRWRAEVNGMFNGKKDSADYKLLAEDNELYSADPVSGFTPAWAVFNLRLGYQFNRHLSAQFACENVFDRFYRVFASGISAPGRNLIFTLRCKW
jgi:hemoglobin/transferrin/lactoferrin receptor protein